MPSRSTYGTWRVLEGTHRRENTLGRERMPDLLGSPSVVVQQSSAQVAAEDGAMIPFKQSSRGILVPATTEAPTDSIQAHRPAPGPGLNDRPSAPPRDCTRAAQRTTYTQHAHRIERYIRATHHRPCPLFEQLPNALRRYCHYRGFGARTHNRVGPHCRTAGWRSAVSTTQRTRIQGSLYTEGHFESPGRR